MSIRSLRFVVLILAALSLGMSFAHVLEMPVRRSWDQSLWVATTVHGNLYRMFGPNGPGAWIDLAAVLGAMVLAYQVRADRRVLVWTGVGAGALVAAHAAWWGLVFPANLELANWVAGPVPADWARWRDRWEFGHAAVCVLKFAGFVALLGSALPETVTGAGKPAPGAPRPRPA
jgi:hypothetical protein